MRTSVPVTGSKDWNRYKVLSYTQVRGGNFGLIGEGHWRVVRPIQTVELSTVNGLLTPSLSFINLSLPVSSYLFPSLLWSGIPSRPSVSSILYWQDSVWTAILGVWNRLVVLEGLRVTGVNVLLLLLRIECLCTTPQLSNIRISWIVFWFVSHPWVNFFLFLTIHKKNFTFPFFFYENKSLG